MSTILQERTPDQADLNMICEALLDMVQRDKERPHYTDRALDRKIGIEHRREPVYASLSKYRGDSVLLQHECEGLCREAKLTARQEKVFRQRLGGMTFEEIGGRGGNRTKQSAQRVFMQALKKIARAYEVYPYIGMSDVYRQETRRGRVPRRSCTMSR